jgi:hypothetical protein
VGDVMRDSRDQFSLKAVNELCARFSGWNVTAEQKDAWAESLGWIWDICSVLNSESASWLIRPECHLPLISDRPDFVLDCGAQIFAIEAKTGKSHSISAARSQAMRYGETIRRLLSAGSEVPVSSVVLVSKVPKSSSVFSAQDPRVLTPKMLGQVLRALPPKNGTRNPGDAWEFNPRPDVIRAAVELVAMNDDRAINSSLANDVELQRLIEEITDKAAQLTQDEHAIFFVSGKPGTGKTLIGLRLAHDPLLRDATRLGSGLYLSGNGPLVDVLVESLARDYSLRTSGGLKEGRRIAGTKIRLIHGFHAELNEFKSSLLVFDEGQRVWTKDHMRRKKADRSLNSEAAELLDAATKAGCRLVVVLIGTGQEINTGEEGIRTWVEALNESSTQWKAFAADSLLESFPKREVARFSSAPLELNIPRRTELNEDLPSWVNLVLDGDVKNAAQVARSLRFPIWLTRSLPVAKAHLRERNSRGDRVGLLASSQSDRTQLLGVNVPGAADDYSWTQWYLDELPNLSSSNALETAASEFKCQGLELDAVCVIWSWDMIYSNGQWIPRKLNLRTGNWRPSRRGGEGGRYAINAYRVLMTRARKSLLLFVPDDANLHSCDPKEMDAVADALLSAGARKLS